MKDKLKFFTKLLKSSRGSSMYIYEPKPTFHIVKQNTGHCAYCISDHTHIHLFGYFISSLKCSRLLVDLWLAPLILRVWALDLQSWGIQSFYYHIIQTKWGKHRHSISMLSLIPAPFRACSCCFRHRWLYMLSGLDSSSKCVPCSLILPLSRTRIWSASMTVESLWAITSVVLFCVALRNAFNIF